MKEVCYDYGCNYKTKIKDCNFLNKYKPQIMDAKNIMQENHPCILNNVCKVNHACKPIRTYKPMHAYKHNFKLSNFDCNCVELSSTCMKLSNAI